MCLVMLLHTPLRRLKCDFASTVLILPDGVRTGLRMAESHEAELAHEVELAAAVYGDLAALSGRLARPCTLPTAESTA